MGMAHKNCADICVDNARSPLSKMENDKMNAFANIELIGRVSKVLKEMLGDDFDSETFWDTLDGETDAMDVIGHLIKERVAAKASEIAAKEASDAFNQRKQRMAHKQNAISKALGNILDAAGEKKVVHPLGTVSRTKPRISAKITDESAIPSQLTITITKPDVSEIKKQMEAGETVPGAELVTGEPGLTVRIK